MKPRKPTLSPTQTPTQEPSLSPLTSVEPPAVAAPELAPASPASLPDVAQEQVRTPVRLAVPREHKPVETVQVRKGILGWMLLPKDTQHFPLLTRMFGSEGNTCDDYREPLSWASLEQGLQELREVADDMGLGIRICGNMKVAPVVQLWERAPACESEPLQEIFSGAQLTGDASVWGIADLREPYREALKQALAGGQPFTTGWFSSKKEIQSARVTRTRPKGRIFLEVTAAMDEGVDLVDSAVWDQIGREMGASSGLDALMKSGLREQAASEWLLQRAQELSERGDLGEGSSGCREAHLAGSVGFAKLLAKLEELADECEKELEWIFQDLKERCQELLAKRLKSWRRAQSEAKSAGPSA